MKRLIVLLVCLAARTTFASSPGQPIDCSDWIALAPGYTCTVVSQLAVPDQDGFFAGGSNKAIDNDGRLLRFVEGDCPAELGVGLRLVALAPGAASGVTLGCIPTLRARPEQSNPYDRLTGSRAFVWTEPPNVAPFSNPGYCEGPRNSTPQYPCSPWLGEVPEPVGLANTFQFDAVNGRVLIALRSYTEDGRGNRCATGPHAGEWCDGNGEAGCNCIIGDYPDGHHFWIAAIEGFTPLFEILQTYRPATGKFGFNRPVMPEGFRSADRFDAFWGAVTKPLDLAQAQPLRCNVAPATTKPGDYVALDAATPTPAAGHANYILTSVTYAGQSRVGREANAGHLQGRDAARLPACAVGTSSAARN